MVTGVIRRNNVEEKGRIGYNKKKGIIIFEDEARSVRHTYTANDINGFYFLDYREQMESIADSAGNIIFAQVLAKGAASLYDLGLYYILISEGQKPLVVSKMPASKKKSKELFLARTAGNIKNYLTETCVEFPKKGKSLDRKQLLSIVAKYNACKNSTTFRSNIKHQILVAPVGGLNLSITDFDTSPENYLAKSKFDPSTGYFLGLALVEKAVRYSDKASLEAKLTFLHNSYSAFTEYKTTGSTQVHDVEFKLSTLRANLGVRIFFVPAQRGIFINPNATVYKILNYSSSRYSYELLTDGTKINELSDDDIFDTYTVRSYSIAYGLGVGWNKTLSARHAITALIGGERDSGITRPIPKNDAVVYHTTINWYLTVSYSF